MPVLSAIGAPFEQFNGVGAAIMRIAPDQLHCGIIFKKENEEPKLVHLLFHHILKVEDLSSQYRWTKVEFDEYNSLYFVAKLSMFDEYRDDIPYGFDPDGVCFDAETLELLSAPVGKGFTCATFVTGFFSLYGFPLLDAATWPQREEDRTWQEKIILALTGQASPEHIEMIRRDLGAVRFKPEEVVASASQIDRPVSYGLAVDLARELLSELNS